MLRIYFFQHWFNHSDPAADQAIYDSRTMHYFVGIDLGCKSASDGTTICKFRHLMEKHNLIDQFFQLVNKYLQQIGIKAARGTTVDATIINAPSSTKNKDKRHNSDMLQSHKDNQWYFGMKAHIGVDSRSKLIHSVVVTVANVHDSALLGDLLHGEETRVLGEPAYASKYDTIIEYAPQAKIIHRTKAANTARLRMNKVIETKKNSAFIAKSKTITGHTHY